MARNRNQQAAEQKPPKAATLMSRSHHLKSTMSTPASARPSRKARSSTPKYVVDSDEDDIGSDSPIEIDDGDDSSVEPKPSTSSKRAPRRSAASAKKASYKDADSDDDDDGESSFHSSSASDVMSVDSSFSDDDFGGTTSSAKKKKKAAPVKTKAKKAPAAKAAKTPAGKKKAASGGSAASRMKKSPAAATPASNASVVTTPVSKKKAAAGTGSTAKAKAKTVTPPNTLHESVDVVLPQSILSLGSSGGSAPADCTVLVQIEAQDAMSTLDFHGASGAIGRFEADDEGITMDFKGFQYQGIIHPGPTAMIASINAKSGQMKVESITDEFVTLEKTHDVMARLDAQVEGDLDEGYSTKGHDANVNYSGARGGVDASEAANDCGGGGKKSGGGKKRASGGGAKNAGGASAKKRKAAPKK